MPKVCRSQIERFLGLLTEPGQVVELRLLGVSVQGRQSVTMSGYFKDHAALASAADKHGSAARGVYVTLNPVNPALFARAGNRVKTIGKDDPLSKDTDVVYRRWLPIDVDPIRPAGISSSAEEHDCALARVLLIRDDLRREGWPDPMIADSGNGGHLLYRVDLPANDEGMVKGCLAALAHRYDDDRAKVDQAVFNPARIWKLYGTVSRKGDDVLERPHRPARLLEAS